MDEIFTKSESLFKENAARFMPTFFSEYKQRSYDRTDYYEVIFTLPKQQNLSKMAIKFIENMPLRTLYAVKSGDGKFIQTVLYSIPYENEMYSVYMSSNQYGLIDELRVHFYDSLDNMYRIIQRAWVMSFSLSGILIEGVESEAELIKSFV